MQIPLETTSQAPPRRYGRRRLVRVVLIVLLVWLVVNCGLFAAVHLYGQRDQAQGADVIIVLGAGLRRDNQPGPALLRRSERAAALYRDGYAPVVICTGGQTSGRTRSEADACRQVLEANGVPASAILLEARSRSTEENALYARELMLAQGWQDAVLVSDGYHLLRAQWIFTGVGVAVYPSPAATRPRLATYGQAILREIAALHWHLITELLNLPVTYVPIL
ncbi:MAG: YdcF family protein [Chloroflexota bacterium]|nr:YdcF family protein [Chloroflexota bacterium]